MPSSFANLRLRVEAEISEYSIADPLHAIGSPLPASWFAEALASMKEALIAPYPARMRDMDQASGGVIVLEVVVVADDGQGTVVVYDPVQDGFVLAARDEDRDHSRAVGIVSAGVRGSAVDCFLSA